MQRSLLLSVFIFCSIAYLDDALAVEVTRAEMLSLSCVACHGTDGKSPGAIPSINGKSTKFLAQALHDFQQGKRSATVMGRHATGYSDKEIQLIADYFSRRR